MTTVVTGGRGFLGTSLVRCLSTDNSVTVIDNASGALYLSNRHDDSVWIQLDVRSGDLTEHIRGADTVWHLAAINGTRRFYEFPRSVLSVQIEGTLNVISACESAGVRRLFLFSSSEVYQTPPVIPTPEGVPLSIPDVTNPRYSYAGSKIAAELLAWHSLIPQVITIRPHNVYGPGMHAEHVIPELVDRILELGPCGGTVTVASDALATRSFVYIDDFVDAMLTIDRSLATGGSIREIFHVGSGEETHIDDLPRMLGELLNVAVVIERGQSPAGSTLRRCPDVTKLRALGWQPRVSLAEGLRRVVGAAVAAKADYAAVRDECARAAQAPWLPLDGHPAPGADTQARCDR